MEKCLFGFNTMRIHRYASTLVPVDMPKTDEEEADEDD
jgi:hypothetical protein